MGPAVIDKNWYFHHTMKHLTNTHTYTHVGPTCSFSFTPVIHTYVALVKRVVTLDETPHQNKSKLEKYLLHKTSEFTVPPFYTVPKVHKTPVSTRPISASHSFFSSPLASWLNHTLFLIIKQLPTVAHNSFMVLDACRSLCISHNHFLVSADIVSMYPNIDIPHALQLFSHHLPQFLSHTHTSITLEALEFLLRNHYTEFDKQLYHQQCGTAMGVQFAPSYANFYTYFLYLPVYTKYRQYLTLYRTYIDDVFFIWVGDRTTLEQFIIELNSCHPNIQLETNISHQSNIFLDIEFINRSPTLHYKPFRKPHNPHLYIPYTSNHPTSNKKGWIKGELIRLARLSSHIEYFTSARSLFYTFLLSRHYPPSFLKPIFYSIAFPYTPRQTHRAAQETTYLLTAYSPVLTKWKPLSLLHDLVTHYNLTEEQRTLLTHTTLSWKTFPNLSKRLVRASLPT